MHEGKGVAVENDLDMGLERLEQLPLCLEACLGEELHPDLQNGAIDTETQELPEFSCFQVAAGMQ